MSDVKTPARERDEARRVLREALLVRLDAVLDLTALRARGRANVRPMIAFRKYRGTHQVVAGYTWSRPYAHFMTGRVIDTVLGWGPSANAAVEDAIARTNIAKAKS